MQLLHLINCFGWVKNKTYKVASQKYVRGDFTSWCFYRNIFAMETYLYVMRYEVNYATGVIVPLRENRLLVLEFIIVEKILLKMQVTPTYLNGLELVIRERLTLLSWSSKNPLSSSRYALEFFLLFLSPVDTKRLAKPPVTSKNNPWLPFGSWPWTDVFCPDGITARPVGQPKRRRQSLNRSIFPTKYTAIYSYLCATYNWPGYYGFRYAIPDWTGTISLCNVNRLFIFIVSIPGDKTVIC